MVSNPKRAEGLRELGASEVIIQMDQAQALFDLILESVGGASLTAALNLVTPHGTIVAFGNSSGEDTPFNLYHLFGHEGMRLQTFFSYNPSMVTSISADLATLVTFVAEGKLTAPVGLENSWRELVPALAALQDRQIQGKAVFHVN